AGLGIFGRGAGALMAVLERATGVDVLRDLAEFFNAFGGMADGFRDRARAVEALLASEAAPCLLAASPQAAATAPAAFFRGKLAEAGMPFGALVVNRVREPVAGSGDTTLAAELERLLGPSLARKALREVADRDRLAARDAANVERLRAELGGVPLVAVP